MALCKKGVLLKFMKVSYPVYLCAMKLLCDSLCLFELSCLNLNLRHMLDLIRKRQCYQDENPNCIINIDQM